jgi:4-amino-4-deoxy-L-arabinose transferase-like glycosyltransferase
VPDWALAIPESVWIGGFLVLVIAGSTYLRTRDIGGQYWMDEALAVGIASHPLSAIPEVLRHDGSPPLYYVLLHVWMRAFGNSESATHWMSLLFGLLTIPVGMWAGWSLFGRRVGIIAAVLFASNAFITVYGQETRMYSLMVLLGLVATAGFLHGFVHRRRGYIPLFVVAQALMLYTHSWGIFFGVGSALTLVLIYWLSDDRDKLPRDAVLAYVAAAVLYLPWLPTFLYQAAHTAAPWDTSPRFGAPIQLSRGVLGGDRVTAALVLSAVIGLAGLMVRSARKTLEARLMWALIALPTATLLIGWLSSQVTPAWVPRYFAPIVGPILLLIALGIARAGLLGLVGLVLSVLFVLDVHAYSPQYKSDMREIGGELAARLHPGDLVIVGQPEQTPLAYYYLPGGLRFANTAGGAVADPTYMNWVRALPRLRHTNERAVMQPLINALRPGQQLLYVRPLTEGAQNWQAPWTSLVRRRSAQLGAIIASDRQLVQEAWAPHVYQGACCVANSAVLYRKLS